MLGVNATLEFTDLLLQGSELLHKRCLLVMGLGASLLLIGVELAFPDVLLYEDLAGVIRQIDFQATVLNGMLAFLLFAGALHVNLSVLRDRALTVGSMATMPGIGIVPLSEEVANRYGLRGIVVQAIRPESSAAAAGLVGIDQQGRLGDVIVAVDRKPVGTVAELAVALERVGIENNATLTVVREGARGRVPVTVQDIS